MGGCEKYLLKKSLKAVAATSLKTN